MMKKSNYVIAYDLDGTLLRTDNTIHPYNLEILKQLQELGHKNVIATGRGLQKVLKLLDLGIIKYVDYLICSNGSVIYSVKDKTYEVLNSLDKKYFDLVADFAYQNNLIFLLDTLEFTGAYFPNNQIPAYIHEEGVMDINFDLNASLEKMRDEINKKDAIITQLAIRNPKKIASQNTLWIKENVNLEECEVYLTNLTYTDLNPKDVNKNNAINNLLDKLNISKQYLIAFGDSGNDTQMLLNAEYGIALGNATLEAKQNSNEVIGDHNSPAIGEFLKNFFNI